MHLQREAADGKTPANMLQQDDCVHGRKQKESGRNNLDMQEKKMKQGLCTKYVKGGLTCSLRLVCDIPVLILNDCLSFS